jgi:hypothetical protein
MTKLARQNRRKTGRDACGRWLTEVSGNPKGRPLGAKDKIPRGSVRAAYLDLIENRGGHDLMVNAAEAALKAKGKLALGYMELAARVLDRADSGGAVAIGAGPDKLRIVVKWPEDRQDT